ncbi:MAG: tetratricopeptide repeat protein, partial [Deltaproteobacteria bacterium]|nr:tetratricopeptide repeat protein [Deltaproteobacteria bacterium]
GWLWYLVTLVPVIGLIQVGMQARADRYLYLPQIGLTLALAWGARSAFASTRNARYALGAASGVAVLVLSGVAWRQTSHWLDTATLYAHALEVTNGNFLAHHGIAFQFLDSGDPVTAETHFERAVAIKPLWPSAHMGLGDARIAQGRVEEALSDYRRAIPESHLHFARALADHGKVFRATSHYQRAIDLYEDPNAYAHASLAALHARSNQLVPAEEQYRIAIALKPDFAEAQTNLAFLLIRQQRFGEARVSLVRAQQLGQDSAELHFAVGVVALEHDEPAEAVRHPRRTTSHGCSPPTPIRTFASRWPRSKSPKASGATASASAPTSSTPSQPPTRPPDDSPKPG